MTTARYSRIRAIAEISELSDYSKGRVEQVEATRNVATGFDILTVAALTTGLTINLDNYTTVYDILVFNADTTNYVDVSWTYSAATRMTRCDAANFIKISRPTISGDLVLTANTATVECEVWILGA